MAAPITITTATGRVLAGDLSSFLTLESREATRVEANRWIKRLRLAPYDGVPMRQRFTYRDDSLWWFTELYLHKMRTIDLAVSTVLALEAVRAADAPARIALESLDPTVRAATVAFGQAHGIPVELKGAERVRRQPGWSSYLIGLSARLSRLRPQARVVRRSPAIAAFVHTAFWRHSRGTESPQQESYIGAVLDAIAGRVPQGDLYCVGVGPRRNFRARRWWDPLTSATPHARLITPVERLAPRDALTGSLTLWRNRQTLARALTTGDGIRDAARFRGCDLWPILKAELEDAATLQWPWSARAMDEAGAALDALSPSAVVTYAEAGGWGRALMLEARRRRVPSVGLQHGFIYRHWLNYLHEADEMTAAGADRGCPIPDRTLVFDRYAESHLRSAGHFPDTALQVTGNARLDQLSAQCAALRPIRAALRRELGVDDVQPLAVLAAKFSEIRDVLPDLVEAVRRLPHMRLMVKTHPAETPDAYATAVSGVPQISVTPASADLARLLVACDAIVTMNSTVAIDGLALGVPALVIGLPNNLSPFVDAGAMLGANGAEAIGRHLQALLYDAEARRTVIAGGTAFARQFELASDGHAADRAASAILTLGGRQAGEPSATRGT